MADQGSSCGNEGGGFILYEADCSDIDGEDETENCNSDIEDFIDNAVVRQGNHLALYQTIQKKAGEEELLKLKRKLLLSPSEEQASEAAAKRTPLAPRQLNFNQENEASHNTSRSQVSNGTLGGGRGNIEGLHLQLLRAKNASSCKLALFKEVYIASFCDLTRVYKHNKTTNSQWVAAVFGVKEPLLTAAQELISKDCIFCQIICRPHEKGNVACILMQFKVSKSRDTVSNYLSRMLNVTDTDMLLQPPRVTSVCSALFWYKSAMAPATFVYGEIPLWIKQQTLISEQTGENSKFNFNEMVQWAYDHQLTDESKIAYDYAAMSFENANAKAWLGLTNQAKIVKDVSTMVRHYLKAEIANMTISAYIHRQCKRVTGQGSWVKIMNFLKHQNIEPIRLVNAFRPWLQGIPKKNCIAIIGHPNTGKSLFSNSLIHFLGGKVLSFACHKSHFWLTPLAEARVALIDDATVPCLKYFDTYMRNVLDGYEICIDRKHRSAVQTKAPPIILTTNVDFNQDERFHYLKSRMITFYFNEPCPMDDNNRPLFQFTDADWNSFFRRLWQRLDLSDQEEESEDGGCGTVNGCPGNSNGTA